VFAIGLLSTFNFTLQKMASSELSALLSSSRNLTSHLSRPELPAVRLSLDQVEAQSRRLVSRQPGTTNDTDRAYVLAKK
jgi:nuclear pore complex protein Nup93